MKSPISSQSERSTSDSDVSSRTPQSRGPSARATSSAVRTESFSKSTSTVTFMSSGAQSAKFRAARDGVAAVGRDQRVRHRAEAAAAPPRRLLVGRDADRRADDLARDVGRVAVARLHAVVVVAGRHEDDRLAVRRLEHVHDVRRDQRPPRERAEVDASRGARTSCSRPRSSARSRTARSGRRRRARAPSSASQSSAQSLRIAIASSIPPRYAFLFWKTCMTTLRAAAVLRAASRACG